MLISVSIIFITGFILSGIFKKMKLPGLLGMILTGIILGPYALDLIAGEILDISSDLRQIALVVVLANVGLSLDLKDLKRVGRPAILLSFLPAVFEITAITILGKIILGLSLMEAALLGSVLAAISPAVVVPRMIKLQNSGYGKKRSIPQLIMGAASLDDILVLVIFAALLGFQDTGSFDFASIATVPLSLVFGFVLGVAIGMLLVYIFKKIHMRDTVKTVIIISASFVMISVETLLPDFIPISGLLAVLAMCGTILKRYELLAKRIIGKFSKIWLVAEVVLFVLVGAAMDITYIPKAGIAAVAVILGALAIRLGGVYVSLIKTPLNKKEKLFCAVSYIPKATVQAAIGAIPLSMGLASGDIILTMAVLSILITASTGAIGMDMSYKKLLEKD